MFRNFIFFIVLSLVLGCSSKEDPNYKWLLGLTQPPASSESSGTSPTTSSTGSVTSTDTSNPVSSESTTVQPKTEDVKLQVSDVVGSSTFLFETTKTLDVAVTILDPVAPVNGTMVRFIDVSDPTANRIVFKAVTDQNGNVTGSFTINTTTNLIRLEVDYNGQTIVRDVEISNVKEINRTLTFSAKSIPIIIVDKDKDGVPDDKDQFPDDPTRSTTVSYPGNGGYYTIAYEDLYPVQGDADFNDYVLRVQYEEDLNSKGEVVRVRGKFQHIAKGAGYNHTFHLNLPGVGKNTYTLKRYALDGTIEKELSSTLDNFQKVEIMPASNSTISVSNTAKTQKFVPGKKAELEVIFDTPVLKHTLGGVPYDVYIYVLNTKKEIHFAGIQYDANGKDKYLDSTGFPWVLMMPGDWSWPYEKGNIHNAYLKFFNWYSSNGQLDKDWYKYPESEKVFPLN